MTSATAQQFDPSTLDSFTGKRVTLTFNREVSDGEGGTTTETVTQEGRVTVGHPQAGLMFKEKGKSNEVIIEPSSIVDVSELATREPKVTVKTLQPIATGRVRQHLADRHGWTLEQANGLTEAQAAAQHESLDHSGLAHKHEVSQAEAEASDTISYPDDVEGAEPEPDAGE